MTVLYFIDRDIMSPQLKIHNGYYVITHKNKSWFFNLLDTNVILEDEQLVAFEALQNSQAEKEIEA